MTEDLKAKIVITGEDKSKQATESAKHNVDKLTSSTTKNAKTSELNSKRVVKANKKISLSYSTLIKTAKLAGAAIVSVFTAIAGTAAAVFNASKTYQSLNASLKTVTGSAENAESAFNLISEFSKRTPFQLKEVADAFIKLKSLGLDPSEEALESYGNTASAMGKSLNQFIEAVADATTNEFERLKEFGIKAKQQGDDVSFTFQGVTTTVAKNAAEIEGYLRGIGNVQFAGAMDEQMQTIGGQLSNLKDSFFRLAVDIGKSGASDAISGLMSDIALIVQDTSKSVISNAGVIREAFNSLIGSARFFGNAFIAVFNGIQLASRILVRGLFGFAADINNALSVITFGETSKEFAKNAQNMEATMADLEQDIAEDAFDIKNAIGDMATSFTKIKIEQDKATASTKEAIKSNEDLKPAIDKTTDALKAQAAAAAAVSRELDQVKSPETETESSDKRIDTGLKVKRLSEQEGSLSEKIARNQKAWEEEKLRIKRKQAVLDAKNPFKVDNTAKFKELLDKGDISQQTFDDLTVNVTAKLKLPTQEQIDNDLRAVAENVLISLGVDINQQATVEAVKKARDEAQRKVEPIIVPVVFKSDSQSLGDQLEREVLKRGRRR